MDEGSLRATAGLIPTQWLWRVTGESDGKQSVIISLQAVIPREEGTTYRPVLRTTERLLVHTPWRLKVGRFIEGHLEFLLDGIGGWLVAKFWTYTTWWNRRKRRAQGFLDLD
jgi:hypothetical protein